MGKSVPTERSKRRSKPVAAVSPRHTVSVFAGSRVSLTPSQSRDSLITQPTKLPSKYSKSSEVIFLTNLPLTTSQSLASVETCIIEDRHSDEAQADLERARRPKEFQGKSDVLYRWSKGARSQLEREGDCFWADKDEEPVTLSSGRVVMVTPDNNSRSMVQYKYTSI